MGNRRLSHGHTIRNPEISPPRPQIIAAGFFSPPLPLPRPPDPPGYPLPPLCGSVVWGAAHRGRGAARLAPAAREHRVPGIDSPPSPVRISPPDSCRIPALRLIIRGRHICGGGGRCGRVPCRDSTVRGAGREYPARPLAAFRGAVGSRGHIRLRCILAETGTGLAMGDAAPHRPRQLSAVRANSIFPLCP